MTILDRLVAFFQMTPGQAHDGRLLAEHFGAYGWRTQVSRARRERGLCIVNRQRTIVRPDGSRFIVSTYCYQPKPTTPSVSTPPPRVGGECRCGGTGWMGADADGRSVRRCVCRAECEVRQ